MNSLDFSNYKLTYKENSNKCGYDFRIYNSLTNFTKCRIYSEHLDFYTRGRNKGKQKIIVYCDFMTVLNNKEIVRNTLVFNEFLEKDKEIRNKKILVNNIGNKNYWQIQLILRKESEKNMFHRTY